MYYGDLLFLNKSSYTFIWFIDLVSLKCNKPILLKKKNSNPKPPANEYLPESVSVVFARQPKSNLK